MKEFKGYNRGINLGGWLSQCNHEEEHYVNFITKADIKQISQWGLDHVRLPIDYQLVKNSDGTTKETGFTYIDNCIDWCKEYGLNLIIDLHKTAGFSFDEANNSFFENPILQDNFIEFWEDIAARYGQYSDTIAFELLNEVVEDSVSSIWNNIAKRAIITIRQKAPDTKIIIGGTRNNSVKTVKKLRKPFDENIVYTFHFYEPLIFTHQGAYWIEPMHKDYRVEYPAPDEEYIKDSKNYLFPKQKSFLNNCSPLSGKDFFRNVFAEAIKVAEERNVALYCGEYGVIDKASDTSTINWISDISEVFREYNIGRALWNYKGKDFGIIDIENKEIMHKIIEML
jgi:aryl-phospho-beta-D-glucosidase BglC (GH1 family)